MHTTNLYIMLEELGVAFSHKLIASEIEKRDFLDMMVLMLIQKAYRLPSDKEARQQRCTLTKHHLHPLLRDRIWACGWRRKYMVLSMAVLFQLG